MSNRNGPSASEVAKEVWRKNIEAKLRVEKPNFYSEKYLKTKSSETAMDVFVGIGVIGCLGISFEVENFTLAVIGGLVAIISGVRPRKSDAILGEFEDEVNRRSMAADSTAQKVEKMISEKDAMVFGDQIIAHEGATIVNRSVVVNSFNAIGEKNEELARAISTLAGFIEKSNNSDAAEVYEDLLNELRGDSRPSRVRSFWNEIVRLLPDVEKLTSVIAAITKLF